MWTNVSDDPNSQEALGYRQERLDTARRLASKSSRLDVVIAEAAGKRVLDVGCAGHAARIGQPNWLHGRIADVASEAIGIDIDKEGVDAMNRAGYRALVASTEEAHVVLREAGAFDVVIAADVIEHLPSPQSLLSLAASVLVPGGRLVVTTPNPFAPWRVRAARRHVTKDNVDHVVLLFPSGIAEMADRTGLRLVGYTTVGFRNPYREARRLLGELRTYRRWRRVVHLSDYVLAVRHGASTLGETSVYVLGNTED